MAKITVQEKEINIITVKDNDYISLTDMLKLKMGTFLYRIGCVIGIRLSILGSGKEYITLILIMANMP